MPPDYKQDDFGGAPVTSTNTLCKSFRNQFNHCYEGTYINGKIQKQKRSNATQYEEQTNGCFGFYCDDDIGKLSWSLCNTTNETTRICVNEQCANESVIPDGRIWSVVIKVKDVEAINVNISEIAEDASSLIGGGPDSLSVGLTVDDDGYVIDVIVYVDDEETANLLVEGIYNMDKGEGCKYHTLCKSTSASIEVADLDISSANRNCVVAMDAISFVIMMMMMIMREK